MNNLQNTDKYKITVKQPTNSTHSKSDGSGHYDCDHGGITCHYDYLSI